MPSPAELELTQLVLSDPDEYERRLRSYKLLVAIGDDPLDVADACRRADAGEQPDPLDLAEPEFDAEFVRALPEVACERRRRDRAAAGLLARARLHGGTVE
ncbi:MAG: hypothetical protein ACYDA5_10935 [Vulcanimicrobiaceae bacterium]